MNGRNFLNNSRDFPLREETKTAARETTRDHDDTTFCIFKKDQLIKINLIHEILTGWRGFCCHLHTILPKYFFVFEIFDLFEIVALPDLPLD